MIGKVAVDLGDLRQVGDVLRPHAVALDAAGQRLDDADDALEQGRLAGAVRSDHGGQRAGSHRAVEMMHGRMAVIAERQIAELMRGHRGRSSGGPQHHGPDQRDQRAGKPSRFDADSRSNEGERTGDGWAALA